jgi:hypothetical protein
VVLDIAAGDRGHVDDVSVPLPGTKRIFPAHAVSRPPLCEANDHNFRLSSRTTTFLSNLRGALAVVERGWANGRSPRQ